MVPKLLEAKAINFSFIVLVAAVFFCTCSGIEWKYVMDI